MQNKISKKVGYKLCSIAMMVIIGDFGGSVALAEGNAKTSEASRIEQGKELAFNRRRGNCLACHMIADGALPGNIAPPLIAMKQRFPDFERLVNQISNPLASNANSFMPPFGLHNILTDDEINMVAEYLYTL